MESTTILIDGMSCGHCTRAVREALEAVEGVEVREVEIGSAQVAFDPHRTGADALVEAVEGEGYTVRQVTSGA